MWFGNVTASDTITIPWDVVSLQSGSVTPTTAGSIVIYKNNSATQRTSASGVTDTRTFDSVTGTNLLTIDLSDNTDAGFYAVGNNYHVMVSGMVVGGLTINQWIASFSIQNRNDYADVREWLGTAVATPTTGGVPEVDITHIAGSAVSTSSAQIGVNVVNAGGTAWASGSITAGVIAADAIGASELAADAIAEIADAVWDEDATGHQTQGTFGQAIGDPGADSDTIWGIVNAIGATGTGLSAIPWNASWDAEVQSEVDDALVAQNLDHLVKIAVDTNFATTVHADSVIGQIADNGAGFDRTTDSLEAIRDRGDAAWVTATGFSTHSAADVWSVATRSLTVLDEDSTTLDLDATIRSAVGLASANLDTQLTDIDNYLDTEVAAIKAKTDNLPASPAATGDAMTLTSAYDFAKGTVAMTEAYAANGAAPTPVQAFYAIHQMLMQFSIASTTITVKKLDNSTTAFSVTLNDATTPTSAVRT